MAELLGAIDDHREAILLGEIGALLHMFGKCSSEFLKANSLEGGPRDSHQDLKHLPTLTPHLQNEILSNAFAFVLNGQQETLTEAFTDFITRYKGSRPDSILLRLFNACHRMTSADEKGVVRQKQPKDDMWIATPFGYQAQKIDYDSVDAKREEMDRYLADAFHSYLSTRNSVDILRDQVVRILQPGLSQALGETRRPANDVTLWAQSHSVASLYKPVLAMLAMGRDPCSRKQNGDLDYNNVRWRLFGVGWNGLDFVGRGRRPGDILKRQEILDETATAIRKLLEVTHPVGNRFYGDINGAFFTFPAISDGETEELVRQIAPELTRIVREQSEEELWPFFTMSRPSRTLTVITREIEARDHIASAPKIAALLSMDEDGDGRQDRLLVPGPTLATPAAGQDICPVCQVRSKPIREETCPTCRDRRSRRQRSWQENRQDQTIWMDEVSDKSNRIALLTIRFDLSRWLSGEWLSTILSQTCEGWLASERTKKVLGNAQQRQKLETIISPIKASREVVTAILKHVGTGQVAQDAGFKATVMSTFFEDVETSQNQNDPHYIVPFLNNLRERINDSADYHLSSDDLTTAVFTQNPSPARLARIWEETETFLDTWLAGIRNDTFAIRPQRLRFTPTQVVSGVREGQTYRVVVPDLTPEPLVVLCLDESGRNFVTVDSLEKFRFDQGASPLREVTAVQHGLEEKGIESWSDEATGEPLATWEAGPPVRANHFQTEPYLPLIVLARSPVFCQVLLPADRVPEVLRRLLALTSDRFGKVEGKLPLHVGLVVTKRKFPLYALIEAGQQILDDPSVQKGISQVPWWDTTGHVSDPFYVQYPTVGPNDRGHKLAGLAPVNGERPSWLTPGYFDFDFLGATSDRDRLAYGPDKSGRPVRSFIAYGHLRPRPFPLHLLRTVFEIWALLTRTANLGPTQRHQLEEALATKLEEWDTIGDNAKPVFEIFTKTLLCHSFGKQWKALDSGQRGLMERSAWDGLLLETLELFQHVLKKEPSQ